MGVYHKGERMIGTVQGKCSQDLNFEIPLRQDLPFHLLRSKSDFRILRAFQNIFVHFVIAGIAAAVPARGVNHNQAAGMTCGGIEFHRSTLELERPMDSVKDIPESEVHLCLAGVEFQLRFLRWRWRCAQNGDQNKQKRDAASPQELESDHGFGVLNLKSQLGLARSLRPSLKKLLKPKSSGENVPS